MNKTHRMLAAALLAGAALGLAGTTHAFADTPDGSTFSDVGVLGNGTPHVDGSVTAGGDAVISGNGVNNAAAMTSGDTNLDVSADG
ncbi:hypothetical protein [Streptomyces sp. NPDC048623]|uniref:hypothetical protein n=1 Tax=Streptomyces sp. NPDC048623 TaxID=3155761 RepID=UPI003419E9CB